MLLCSTIPSYFRIEIKITWERLGRRKTVPKKILPLRPATIANARFILMLVANSRTPSSSERSELRHYRAAVLGARHACTNLKAISVSS